MTAVVEVESLTIRYADKTALRDVDFRYDGGAIGLLGPNGAGKSSLIRAVLGLVAPASGRARVLGFDPTRQGIDIRVNSGYMPENDCHIPGLTGVEFVAYSGRMCGLSANDARRRAHEVLVYVGMEEERYRPVDEYSRGMKQKVKLASALVHDPAILFLDEPTNGLDPQARTEVLKLIDDLAHRKEMNVVLSSHLLKDVESVCESMVLLAQGQVRASGRIADLKSADGGYEVRIDGDPTPYHDAARAAGYRVEKDARGRHVVFGDEERPVTVADLYRIGRDTGLLLSHVVPAQETLEDLFLRSLGDAAKE